VKAVVKDKAQWLETCPKSKDLACIDSVTLKKMGVIA